MIQKPTYLVNVKETVFGFVSGSFTVCKVFVKFVKFSIFSIKLVPFTTSVCETAPGSASDPVSSNQGKLINYSGFGFVFL